LIECAVKDSGMMDMDEFTSMMHCKRLTVYRWCKRGLIPCIKIGRKILFRRSDVETLITNNMRNESISEKAVVSCH